MREDSGSVDASVVVLPFDFVLKRSLGNNGAGFARSVLETRPFFEASA